MTDALPHAFDCPVNGGPAEANTCLMCLHEREMETLTVDMVMEACNEIDERWGRGARNPKLSKNQRQRLRVQHAATPDTTVEQALEHLDMLRRALGIGPLRKNGATCLGCGETVLSQHRHDFRSCKCDNVSVDGGTWYGRFGWKDDGPGYEPIMERWPGTYAAELRSNLSFHEQYGSEGTQPRLSI